ncbi:hypothetical protein ONS96_006923 [Cadophora gregata f. sp. sojae]|nr:hypothetical protein ONS96_006923 [Cadophora gregata f. sp. sojae]
MATTWTSIRIAQVIGLGGAAWLSGNIASLSLITIPTLLNSHAQSQSQSQSSPSPTNRPLTPHTLAQQWRQTYELGKSQNRPISLIIASSFAFLAYKSRSLASASPRNVVVLYGIAAVLTMGIAPFTALVMSGTNEKLIGLSDGKGKGPSEKDGVDVEGKEVRGLLEGWGRLNGVRSLLPLFGGVVGVIAALA